LYNCFPIMRFSRAGSLPLSKVGCEHLSWQSKLALEHKSTLVSIERSLKEGLIQPTKVTEMLQTQDWLGTESLYRQKEAFSPGKAEVGAEKGEPFERFPRMFSESPVRGFRRGYYAPWTKSHFDLNQHLTPTDNRSAKQLMRESMCI